MAPQKFASVRYNKVRPTTRIAPFRDDSSLVALRYEETKQAELPIPLPPPRNPLRVARPHPAAVSAGPIVIAPPQEEHPLFRSRSQLTGRTASDEWKRDSGLAPTSSSVTIRPEFDEDMAFDKLAGGIGDGEGEVPTVYRGEGKGGDGPDPAVQSPFTPPRPPLGLFTIALRSATPETPPEAHSEPSSPGTPTRAQSFTKKLGKAFSIKSASNNRLRKKRMSEDRVADVDPPPQMQPMGSDVPLPPSQTRGSLKSPKLESSKSRSSPCQTEQEDECECLALLPADNFVPIMMPIPADDFFDDLNALSFSNRGSVMFGGKRAINKNAALGPSLMSRSVENTSTLIAAMTSDATAEDATVGDATTPTPSAALAPAPAPLLTQRVMPLVNPKKKKNAPDDTINEKSPRPFVSQAEEPLKPLSPPSIRLLPIDTERESQKVRSLYESGEGLNWQDGGQSPLVGERLEPTEEVPSEEEENAVSSPPSSPRPNDHLTTPSPAFGTPRSARSLSLRHDSHFRREHELAGGLEDWEDVEGADVDRYGFILQTRPVSRPGHGLQDLKSAQLSPRRRNVLTKRPDSAYSSSPLSPSRFPSRKVSARSLNTYTSDVSAVSRQSAVSTIRSATNRLPHNRDRRWMDQAGEMLTLEPGQAVQEDARANKIADAQRKKEWERSEKWRKMAKVIRNGKEGEGMVFEFDAKHPKVIERTWKGIPDCWRATAWHSFLQSSARRWNSEATDEKLTSEFHRLQDVSSSDDVQIDLDVPRTINRHIMFRRRYRGGQRLLFRVLHAISLYFPDTGYVQGMASLAATLLCYYDEEQCFVMLVRLWEYRGLRQLYQPGFGGLMATLQEFENHWLAKKDVARKLNELAIDATAYGTRWYLTLFNLSIPFSAQLRVWDVFMLLGECPPYSPDISAADGDQMEGCSGASSPPGFDILHATGAALIHALREVLLDSDFENAMKTLTSWIPVKDEEMLMKVTRVEYKRHRSKRKEKKA